MSVMRRPSSASAGERSNGFGALQSLSENRPRTSETHAGMRPVSSFIAVEGHDETISHLKAQRAAARERRGLGVGFGEDDENDENIPRTSRDFPRAGPLETETETETALGAVFQPPDRRFERKPPPFERPPHPSVATPYPEGTHATARASHAHPPPTVSEGPPLAAPRPVALPPPAAVTPATVTPATVTPATFTAATFTAAPPASFEIPVAAHFPPPVSIPTVPVHEVAALVAAAVAGEPPRALVSAKGATAAAMASVSETVRRAVTDARREGATMGASEARLALQRASSKAERAAVAAKEAAEASAAEADERRERAEEKRRIAEKRLESYERATELEKRRSDREAKTTTSRQTLEPFDDGAEFSRLREKNKNLRARTSAMATELATLRTAAAREKERADALELRLAKREVSRDAEIGRAKREERAALERVLHCEKQIAAATETLASERASARDAKSAYEVILRETRACAARALEALREDARLLASDARDGARAVAADFLDARRLIAETSSAIAAGTRRRLASGSRRAEAAEKRVLELDVSAMDAETRARNAENRASVAEAKLAESHRSAALERAAADEAAAKLAALTVRCEEDRRANVTATRQRDDALESALKAAESARKEASSASRSARVAEAEAESAWKAAAEAEREIEISASRRREADARGFASRIRALRVRYFHETSDHESRPIKARLDVRGLVEAMIDFKRRRDEARRAERRERFSSEELAETAAKTELEKMEECVLVTLSGDAMIRRGRGYNCESPEKCASPDPEAGRTKRRFAKTKTDVEKTLSDEDVLEMLNS